MRKIPRITDKFAERLDTSQASPVPERKGLQGAEHLSWNSTLSNEDLKHADAVIIDLDSAGKNHDCTQGARPDANTLMTRLRPGASIILAVTHSDSIRQEAEYRIAMLNVLADCLPTSADVKKVHGDQLKQLRSTPPVSRKDRVLTSPSVEAASANDHSDTYETYREALGKHIDPSVRQAILVSTKPYFSSGRGREFQVQSRDDFMTDFLNTCQTKGLSETMPDPNNSANTITLQECLATLVNSPVIQNRIHEEKNQNLINGEVKMRVGKITDYASALAENLQPSAQSSAHKVTLVFSSMDEHKAASVKSLTDEAKALLNNTKVEVKEGDPFMVASEAAKIAPKKTHLRQAKDRVHSDPALVTTAKKTGGSRGLLPSWAQGGVKKAQSTSVIKPKAQAESEHEKPYKTSPSSRGH